jgi:hypothetical protein
VGVLFAVVACVICNNLVYAFWHNFNDTLVAVYVCCGIAAAIVFGGGAALFSVGLFYTMLEQIDALHPYALWALPLPLLFLRSNVGWAMVLSCGWFYYQHGQTLRPVWAVLGGGAVLMGASLFEHYTGYSLTVLALGVVWVLLAWKLAGQRRPDWWKPWWETTKRIVTSDLWVLANHGKLWALRLKARAEPYWEQCKPMIEQARETLEKRYEEWAKNRNAVPPPRAPDPSPQEPMFPQGDAAPDVPPRRDVPPALEPPEPDEPEPEVVLQRPVRRSRAVPAPVPKRVTRGELRRKMAAEPPIEIDD